MTHIYEKGTIKVVWIDDSEFIYSKMFDNEKDAEDFAKEKKDYLVFKLVKQKNMEDFTWILLPYGRYNIYKMLFRSYKKGILLNLIRKLKS